MHIHIYICIYAMSVLCIYPSLYRIEHSPGQLLARSALPTLAGMKLEEGGAEQNSKACFCGTEHCQIVEIPSANASPRFSPRPSSSSSIRSSCTNMRTMHWRFRVHQFCSYAPPNTAVLPRIGPTVAMARADSATM